MRKTTIIAIIVLAGIFLASANAIVMAKESGKTTKLMDTVKAKAAGLVSAFEKLYREFMQKSLPKSLDKYYIGSKPETISSQYVLDMFRMANAFEGIVVNLQERDMTNAIKSYKVFAGLYKDTSNRVPEWEGYFDLKASDKLGEDIAAKDIKASFKDIGAIGATCEKCMGDNMPQVQAKYYWKDFKKVNVKTAQGNMSWDDAMGALDGAYSAIGVDAAKGNKVAAAGDFNQFYSLYTDFKKACSNCHDTPRYYYVSKDVFVTINQMGQNITSGNMKNAIALQQSLGVQCYRCHVLHMPAQFMKNKMPKTQ